MRNMAIEAWSKPQERALLASLYVSPREARNQYERLRQATHPAEDGAEQSANRESIKGVMATPALATGRERLG
jgi:hypothetical protein